MFSFRATWIIIRWEPNKHTEKQNRIKKGHTFDLDCFLKNQPLQKKSLPLITIWFKLVRKKLKICFFVLFQPGTTLYQKKYWKSVNVGKVAFLVAWQKLPYAGGEIYLRFTNFVAWKLQQTAKMEKTWATWTLITCFQDRKGKTAPHFLDLFAFNSLVFGK